MAIRSPKGANLTASPKVSKSNVVVAPVGGIDARTILAGGDPLHCIYAFNLLPNEYGMRVRRGYREWQIGLTGIAGVTSIIPFGGVDDTQTNDRLFAVTAAGIWDVTVAEAAPILKLDFSLVVNGGDTSSDAGRGVYTYFTTESGTELLYYADSSNGLFQYSEVTDLWVRATGITGPDLGKVNFITTHKNQLWLIERNSNSAWYLPTSTISGAAAQFFFGSKFKNGANLAGLFSWTIDGGAGVDDYFVAVSRAGDVLPYRGNDPSTADDWSLTGQWFIGAIPKGSRFGSQEGGNLHLLSIFGLISMDEIIVGVDGKNAKAESESAKIAIIIRNAMERFRDVDGWDVAYIPAQGIILISSPKRENNDYIQYASSLTVEGWGIWRDVPVQSFGEWNGKLYFGTPDGRVMTMDTFLDNVKITPVPDEANGAPINFSVLTTFQDYGEPSLFKRGKYIRPQFVSQDRPAVTCQFRYDYDLTEVINTAVLNLSTVGFWDSGIWDSALWGSRTPRGYAPIGGGWGMGRNVAIAMTGATKAETTLVSWDVVWDSGAPL